MQKPIDKDTLNEELTKLILRGMQSHLTQKEMLASFAHQVNNLITGEVVAHLVNCQNEECIENMLRIYDGFKSIARDQIKDAAKKFLDLDLDFGLSDLADPNKDLREELLRNLQDG